MVDQTHFYGRDNLVLVNNFVESWIRGNPVTKYIILHGKPGLGKTTLAKLMSEKHHLPMVEVNASDSRKVEDLKRLYAEVTTRSLVSKRKLIVLDECDSLPEASVKVVKGLIDSTNNPIILICNDVYALPFELRKEQWVLAFPDPKEKDLVAYGKLQGMSDTCIQAIRPFARSYRGMNTLAEIWKRTGEVGEEIWQDLTTRDAILLFSRNPNYEIDLEPYSLMGWLYDNSQDFAILDRANALLTRPREIGYAYWFYIYSLLRMARLDTVEYPRMFNLQREQKEARTKPTKKEAPPPKKVKEDSLDAWFS